MERSGLVDRRRMPATSGSTRVHLSPQGRALAQSPAVVAAAHVRETIGSLPEADRAELARLLDDLSDKLATRSRRARGTAARADPRAQDQGEPLTSLLRLASAATGGRSSSCWCCCSCRPSPTSTCPTLNADIINHGVVTGDTGYILRDGRRDARRDAALRARRRHRRLLGLEGRDGVRPRRARRPLPPCRELLAGRAQPLRHAVADHADHQRRPAGADGRPDDAQRGDLRADHDDRRHHHGVAAQRAALGRDRGRHPA